MNDDGSIPDEPLSGLCDDKNAVCYNKNIYTKDQPETYDMLYQWRELLDQYTKDHGGDVRIIMTENYASLELTLMYYGDAFGRRGSQVPFNFGLISDLTANTSPSDYKKSIDSWIDNMPKADDYIPNWVIGNHDVNRVASRLGVNRADAHNILIQTLPRIAVTYYAHIRRPCENRKIR